MPTLSLGLGGSVAETPLATKRTRKQVSRACDWCRARRIKCDNGRPCMACRRRDAPCTHGGVDQLRTLPQALMEVDRLKLRVKELEAELASIKSLHQHQRQPSSISAFGHTPGLSTSSPGHPLSSQDGSSQASALPASSLTSPNQQPYTPHSNPEPSARQSPRVRRSPSPRGDAHRCWGGIHIATARSPHKTWYGPPSLFYFIKRITTFLSSTLQQAHSTDEMLLHNSASTLFRGPTSIPLLDAARRAAHSTEEFPAAGDYLSPTQEEYFIDLFWQSYHTSFFPILNEEEFRKHYRSLWMTSGNARKPSALVDIVLAMCMQYGVSMLPAVNQKPLVDIDASVAGRWYYRRCQMLLAYELETPTISTLQCHILCSSYLCCGSFQNMSDSACALAVRMACMLGLHLEPPASMPRPERELRKRLWWVVYILDAKHSMKLGRPFLIHESVPGPNLPDDQFEAAVQSGSHFAPLGDNITWLSFLVQNAKLFQAVRTAYTAFYGRDLNLHEGQSIWDDLQAMESHADFFQPYMRDIEQWASQVPDALKTKRRDKGTPFSTDRSSLEIELFAPLWIQRQRLLLELMYHNLCINLYRPFISFVSSPMPTLAEQMARKCALHAMMLTRILHQVLSSSSILAGWHEVFQWQWNAAMTLIGFVLAYPLGPSTPEARRTVDLSIIVFDIFGSSFAVATTAADIMRKLSTKIDSLLQRCQAIRIPAGQENNMPTAPTVSNIRTPEDRPLTSDAFMPPTAYGTPNLDDVTAASMQDMFQMAFSVDHWSNLDMLWPSMDGSFPEQIS